LVPTVPESGVCKAIGDDTAELFEQLATERPREALPVDVSDSAVAALVLDAVLEIDLDGTFVSGPAALGALYGSHAGEHDRNRLAALSVEAVCYAAALPIEDAGELAARLYMFHRLPVSRRSLSRWPDADAVAEFLGLKRDGENRCVLDQAYATDDDGPANASWWRWSRRDQQPLSSGSRPVYKLYVSPLPAGARTAVTALVETLQVAPCTNFKIANGAFGLARPDKIVCHFSDSEQLMRFARSLDERLGGLAAHGVPFSAALRDDGLLSWGIDPPVDPDLPEGVEPQSWRLWVSERLAAGILAARRAGATGTESWRFALARLELDGVDTETWLAAPSIWDSQP
jgi:hypothetical protein